MRIVAGKHRSRKLLAPETAEIRPTSDKVRQALFNMLNSRAAVVDAVVLDAFCGTGALALEALSQGAARAILIDKNKSSLDLARKNAQVLREAEACQFLLRDAAKAGPRPDDLPHADLVFLDPPYRMDLVQQAVQALKNNNWLAADALIVAELEKDGQLNLSDIAVEFEKTYGDTRIIGFRFTS